MKFTFSAFLVLEEVKFDQIEKNIEDQFEEWLKKLQLEKLKEPLQKKGINTLEQVKTLKSQAHDDVITFPIILSYS